MTRPDDPTPAPPRAGPALVLPRPNLGPEPWSEPASGWGPAEFLLGSIVAALGLALAVRVRRLHRIRRQAARADPEDLIAATEAELRPNHRLIASSQAVRAALIAEFGPTWGSRTTEEIARDPILGDRLGPATAQTVVAYLEQVDRAKFAGEEFEDVEAWIGSAQAFLSQRPRRSGKDRRPA